MTSKATVIFSVLVVNNAFTEAFQYFGLLVLVFHDLVHIFGVLQISVERCLWCHISEMVFFWDAFDVCTSFSTLHAILKGINLISKQPKVFSNHLFKKILVEIGFDPFGLLQIWVANKIAIGQVHCQNLWNEDFCWVGFVVCIYPPKSFRTIKQLWKGGIYPFSKKMYLA